MAKKPNLAEIAQAAGSTRRAAIPPAAAVSVHTAAPERSASGVAATRSGTKQVAGHFPEEVSWQLRQLALEQRSTVQELLGEALNDLFQKYGRPELLPQRRTVLS